MKKRSTLWFYLGMMLFTSAIQAVIVITYNTPDDVILNRVDFSLGSNRIDPIKNIGDDDFAYQGPYGTIGYGQATGNLKFDPDTPKNCNILIAEPTADYLTYFDKIVNGPTNQLELEVDDFNIYSGHSFQLSSLPSDFSIDTDIYKADPQLNSIIDYYVDNVKIEAGQRMVTTAQNALLQIYRKDNIAFGGSYSMQPTTYQITCPMGRRVEFDVNEILNLPANRITFKTKGCVITNKSVYTVAIN